MKKRIIEAKDVIGCLEYQGHTRGTGQLEGMEKRLDRQQELLEAMLAVLSRSELLAVYEAFHGSRAHYEWELNYQVEFTDGR